MPLSFDVFSLLGGMVGLGVGFWRLGKGAALVLPSLFLGGALGLGLVSFVGTRMEPQFGSVSSSVEAPAAVSAP